MGKQKYTAKEKKVSRMTRNGLVEENLATKETRKVTNSDQELPYKQKDVEQAFITSEKKKNSHKKAEKKQFSEKVQEGNPAKKEEAANSPPGKRKTQGRYRYRDKPAGVSVDSAVEIRERKEKHRSQYQRQKKKQQRLQFGKLETDGSLKKEKKTSAETDGGHFQAEKNDVSTNRKKGKQKYSRKTIKTYQEVDKAARKQEAERQNKIPKDSVYTKKTNEEQKAKVKYHLYFDKKTGKTDGKKKTLSSVPKKALKNAVYQKAGEDEEENSAVGNLQTYKTPVELNWYAYISTYYGYSVNNGTGQTQLHRGVTINVRQGTEVKSAMNGFVVDVGYSGTFGNYVVTQDKKGVQIKYAYLQSISVANGQEVTTDTVIGTTGSTGSATGSQLYLELVKDGEYYNPVFYISTGDSGLYVGGGSYDDETVRRLFAEADKYLGMPYVWGGSSPETSFDCSGFVSYVFTNSGVCNMGRLTAQGIYDICMPVSPEEARPGDIIFFTGTYDAGEPVTHVGIYAGDGQMIHCGNPIQYTSINSAYWQSHFYAFGRP